MSDAMKSPHTSAVFDQAREKADLAARAIGRPLDDATLDKIATDADDASVYGIDAKKDRNGKRNPQGIGAPGHETGNHFASILRYEGRAAYEKALREIWKRDPQRAERLAWAQPERLGS